MSAPVNVYERMARIQDALWEAERARKVLSLAEGVDDNAYFEDLRDLCSVTVDLLGSAHEQISHLAEQVREAVGPPPEDQQLKAYVEGSRKLADRIYGRSKTQPTPTAADKPKRKGGRQ
jgi:hypothetical protein